MFARMFARMHKRLESSRQYRKKMEICFELGLAVDNNDLDKVVNIVKEHGNDPVIMNSCSPLNYALGGLWCERPALCHAAANGRIGMVRALLNAPAIDANSVDPIFNRYAVLDGSADYDNLTPLLAAVINQHLDVVKALVAYPKTNVDVMDKTGWTPLMYAAKAGNLAFVEALLNAGANPAITNSSGCAADKIAQLSGHQNIAERIQRQMNQQISRRYGM